MKKLLALVLALALCLTLVAGAASAEATGKVYYLNFKPEADVAGAGQDLHRADRCARHRGHRRLRHLFRNPDR